MTTDNKELIELATDWFSQNSWSPFPFQQEAWNKYLAGYSGLINAPTGFGKTFSLVVPIVLEGIKSNPKPGFRIIWIAPIKALTKEIKMSFEEAIYGLGLDWKVAIRSGDTLAKERKSQISSPPQVLITTPESLHVIFASKGYEKLFSDISSIVIDEWHELMGSKRGVQVELGISRLRGISSSLKVWGISATIDNIDDAINILLGPRRPNTPHTLIKSRQEKHIAVETIMPDEIQTFPWSGYIGIRLIGRVIEVIKKSQSTIIFTNTRAMCEIWYQRILEAEPSLAGIMAMHHGSIGREIRDWVEEAIHSGKLKVVVSTSSLDLGVDFRPVESIVQIGSPKGVSRFIQRAGRSGHQPLAISKIHFVPTHALEIIEGAALRAAIAEGIQEPRTPYIRSFDVLIQYLMTLAVSGGFHAPTVYEEILNTHCYQSLNEDEWRWILQFLLRGGQALEAYDQYQKVVKDGNMYRVENQRIARMHRLSIGTIVSGTALEVRFTNGKYLGSIEEWFIASMEPGDVFWFAGQALEFTRLKEMVVYVVRSKKKKGRVPSWGDGRMPLSSKLSQMIRRKFYNYSQGIVEEIETEYLGPLLDLQNDISALPKEDEFLVEYFVSPDGYHLLMYPFEGRFVHEGMGALLAKRLSNRYAITFSIAMNDYGFELLTDRPIDLDIVNHDLFSTKDLWMDIQGSMNSVEMARRRFRDIAKISGLIFQGYPGKHKKERHLQSSSSLLFDVFKEYDPDNLLYQQTYDEVLTFQLEETRLRSALERIQNQKIIITQPLKFSPFSFPIVVDRMREKLSSERLEDRIKRMIDGN